MLGASLAMLALVSAVVAFGSWPGLDGSSGVDQVILRNAVAAKTAAPVKVRSDAVAVARRQAALQQSAVTGGHTPARAKATLPSNRTAGKTPAPVSSPGTSGQAPAASSPSVPQASNPAAVVQQPAQQVTDTTKNAGGQVQNVTNQVGQVVNQVTSPPPTPTTSTPVQQIQQAVGGVLGR